jgi:hypothetical protein
VRFGIEHPVCDKRLEADDPRMRALEAHGYAQTMGTALNYGKQ